MNLPKNRVVLKTDPLDALVKQEVRLGAQDFVDIRLRDMGVVVFAPLAIQVISAVGVVVSATQRSIVNRDPLERILGLQIIASLSFVSAVIERVRSDVEDLVVIDESRDFFPILISLQEKYEDIRCLPQDISLCRLR